MLYAGLVGGIFAFFVLWRQLSGTVMYSLAAGTILVMVLSMPRLYKWWGRRVRDILRFSTGAAMALYLKMLFTGMFMEGIILSGVMFVFWRIYFRRRRIAKLEACGSCSQLKAGQICEGFSYQAEHLRRYEQAATEYLLAGGYAPAAAGERKCKS